jgi:hypothetical protein
MKTARRFGVLLFIAALLGVLCGCDVFMASKLGRWNPLDPDNELQRVSRSLSPTVDGYVQDFAPERNFGASTLITGDYGGVRVILLVFADLPLSVESAILKLECLNGNAWVDVYPIGQGWSPDTVNSAQTLSTGFVDYAVMQGGDVPGPGVVTFDVTAVVQHLRDNGNYGMILKHYGNLIEFVRGPMLIVEGKDIPE